MRPHVPSGLSTLSAWETVFFGASLSILMFLLFYGGHHKDARKLSAKNSDKNIAKRAGDDARKKDSLYGHFPDDWNQESLQYDEQIPEETRMTTDIHGFPSDTTLRSGSSGSSPRPSHESPAESQFNPSNPDSRLSRHGFAMLKTIGGVLASAPSTLLNVPLSFLGDREKKHAVTEDRGSFNPFDDEPVPAVDEGTFVNINAHNLAGTVERLIDSSEVVKRGKLYTLGARKRDERSPSVKERDFTMTGFYLYYYDKYGIKREFALRNTTVSKHIVRATSGAVDGKKFFAVCIEHGVQHLLLGAADEAYRDEWHDLFVEQVQLIHRQEIENDGEEEEWRHRGLPSKSEMAMLNPIAVNNTLDTLENLGNIRRRFRSEPENVPIGKRRSSIHAKVNAPPIVNPLHPMKLV